MFDKRDIHIEENDSLLTYNEKQLLEKQILKLIEPMILRLKERGYLNRIKTDEGKYLKVVMNIAYVIFTSLRLKKMYEKIKKEFNPFLHNKIIYTLKPSISSDSERDAFINKLILDTEDLVKI